MSISQIPSGWTITRSDERIVVQHVSGAFYAAAKEGESGIAESILYMLANSLLSATLSPAHIEDGEEVEVVGTLIIGEQGWDNAIELNPGPVMALADAHPKSAMPLMTVAQHQRIVSARASKAAPRVEDERERSRAVQAAFNDWAWNKKGEAVGRMDGQSAAIAGFHAGAEWQARAALSAPPAAGWTRAEQHDDISGDFEGYCWIDGRTGQRHWLPHGMNPNEKEPTRTNGGPRRCLFAPEGWACIKQAQHEGPCMAVKLTEGECHATSPAAGVPDSAYARRIIEAGEKLYNELRQWLATESDPSSQAALQEWRKICAFTTPASEQQRAVGLDVIDKLRLELLPEYEAGYTAIAYGDSDQPVARADGMTAREAIAELLRLNPHLQPAAGSAEPRGIRMSEQHAQDAGSSAVGPVGSVVVCCHDSPNCSRCGGTGRRSICDKTACHEYGCYFGTCYEPAPTPPQENDR